jgi:Alpha/beta hydrolase domain
MAVTRLQIDSRGPYEDGREFDAGGAYERLDGSIHFAVDPLAAANTAIVDLDKAERDAAGLVHFWADFCLLQPIDAARANGRLLFDVANRGRRNLTGIFNQSERPTLAAEAIDPGDGFLMRRGWTLAWCGWQWDVLRSPAQMGLEAPQALEHGRPIEGQVLVQFQPVIRLPDHPLCDRTHRPYAAANVEQQDAGLAVRDWLDGPRTVIPRSKWRFARDEDGKPVADDSNVWLEGGFDPGRFYEVVYRTSTCPIVGSGLLAVRDAASFLRYGETGDGNPCASRIERCYGYGVSQTGRFLRHFLYLGLNLDEKGRQVFDGLLPHVAGARRGQFNHRYAQPSQQNTPDFGHLMPFAADEQTDPVTGIRDGILRRQRELGGAPRIIATNSGAEYWRGDGSLLHTDIEGKRDLDPPDEMRIYYMAGTQHTRGTLPLTSSNGIEGASGTNAFNAIDYAPLLRAALVNLDAWVSEGREPPPSVYPRLADGTEVPADEVLEAFRRLGVTTVPDVHRLKKLRRLDLGSNASSGIGRYPPQPGAAYTTYVPAVDSDGNELGGIRLPDVAAPLATYTGWNPRDPATGGDGQIIDMLGSTLPFATTPEERRGSIDPRPSIAERYRNRDEYLARVRAIAEVLALGRYVLAEDIDLLVQTAAERYGAFASARVPS